MRTPRTSRKAGADPAAGAGPQGQLRRRGPVIGVVVLATAALTACQPAFSLVTAPAPITSKATIDAELAGKLDVAVDQPVVVRADQGRLTTVVVTGPKGPLKGTLSPDRSTWVSRTSSLSFGSTYQVEATAVDSRGVATTTTDSFRTVRPQGFLRGSVSPSEDSVVGVGLPITVTFSRPVQDRAAVERRLIVESSVPVVGAWNWQSDQEVMYRPKRFWPGHADISVKLALKGVEAAPGVYGQRNTVTRFRTGTSVVTYVNAQTHSAVVKVDGAVARTIPITTGKPGFETRSGIKLILTKERVRVMDAATGGTAEGDPEYYRVEAPYAMRMTWSGEFLHAAPWSVGSQGRANVSHGCVGMSMDNARWLFETAPLFSPVEVVGTSREQNDGNGITVWNVPWAQWKAGSALS